MTPMTPLPLPSPQQPAALVPAALPFDGMED